MSFDFRTYQIIRGEIIIDPADIKGEELATIHVNIGRGMHISNMEIIDNKIKVTLESKKELM